MEKSNQSSCGCAKASCGCAKTKVESCCCGSQCGCGPSCKCSEGCGCATAKTNRRCRVGRPRRAPRSHLQRRDLHLRRLCRASAQRSHTGRSAQSAQTHPSTKLTQFPLSKQLFGSLQNKSSSHSAQTQSTPSPHTWSTVQNPTSLPLPPIPAAPPIPPAPAVPPIPALPPVPSLPPAPAVPPEPAVPPVPASAGESSLEQPANTRPMRSTISRSELPIVPPAVE